MTVSKPVVAFGFAGLAGCLLWVSVPAFLKARSVSRQNYCARNLRTIQMAKEVCAERQLEERLGRKVRIAELRERLMRQADLFLAKEPVSGCVPEGKIPTCPSGGIYLMGRLGDRPTCSVHGDLLLVYGGWSTIFDSATRGAGRAAE